MKPKFQKAIAGFEDKDKGNLPKSRMEKAEMGNKRKKKDKKAKTSNQDN